MGAWGTGPFDSDSALDFLGDVADQTSRRDDEDSVVPGSVDFAAAEALVGAALVAVTRDAVEGEWRGDTCANAYAAAGLVAAGLAGHDAGTRSGTRLFATLGARRAGQPTPADLDPLGLGTHCGYVALLNAESVARLRDPAQAAVAALRRESGWLADWLAPMDLLDQFGRLETILAG